MSKIILVYSPTIIDLYGKNGGVSRAVIAISEQYVDMGYSVIVLCSKKELGLDGDISDHERNGVVVRFIDGYLDALRKFRIYRSESLIFHIHGYFNFYSELFILLSRLYRLPSILSTHGKFSGGMLANQRVKKLIFNNLLSPLLLGFPKLVTGMSLEEVSNLERYGGRNVKVVKNGIENILMASDFSDMEIENYFLYLGYIDPRKQPLFCLDVLRGLINSGMKIKLVYAGPDLYGHREVVLDAVSKYNLQESVEFIDYIDGEDKFELIAKAKFMILPSLGEGHPLSLCESIGCGTPVLCSSQSNFEEVIEYGCGYVVDGFVAEDWVASALKILDSRFPVDSFDRMISDLSWSSVAWKYLGKN